MLTKIDRMTERENCVIRACDANYPGIFSRTLEFNTPAHGTFNIVHIGMQVPECHQIYICAVNCMRGVVLTAAEMNASDRFSFVILKEEDLLEGTVEDITIEGTADVIEKLPYRPRAVCLFTVCTHHFLGCSISYIYKSLRKRFPDIDFIRGFMDPICQKEGPTPDQKLRMAMYDVLPACEEKKNKVSLIGSNVSLDADNDVSRLLSAYPDMTFLQMTDCRDYDEYLSLSEAALFISMVPNGRAASDRAAKRLGRQALHMPMSFCYEEIRESLMTLNQTISSLMGQKEIKVIDYEKEEEACEAAFERLNSLMGKTPLAIDYTVHPRPIGLALYLLDRGFLVERIYINGISGEEEKDFMRLKKDYGSVLLISGINPAARVYERGSDEKVLAIGQQAAWFEDTKHFVNMVEGGGLYGYGGIRSMAGLLEQAFLEEKDTKDLIVRKGLGCESCF